MTRVGGACSILMIVGSGLACAFADNQAIVDHVTLHDYETYRLKANGEFTYEDDVTDQVTTPQGIVAIGEKRIPFRSLAQRLDILSAYTETPKGEKIPVGPDGLKVQESPLSLAAPLYSDVKVESIVFPRVEVGSKLHFKYRLTELQPNFPGQVSLVDVTAPHSQNDDKQLSVIAPAAMRLHIDVAGYTGGRIDCATGDVGQQCYLWKAKNLILHPPERGSVSWLDYSHRVTVSTFENYQALAAAYEARAADKSKVTPKVQSLADQIVGQTTDKEKQAELLYDWVTSNIRYVAVALGAGSVVPHSADEVIDHRYGDCKDHVALLEALLAAEGIKSTGALVDAGNSYKLGPVPTIASFNHIITYIPSLHRYVDSTAEFAPFGVIPLAELDKNVLRVTPIAGEEPVAVLSQQETLPTKMDTTADMRIEADGTVHGSASIANTGYAEMVARAIFASLPPGQESRLANEMLSFTGQSGDGSFKHADPHDLTAPFSYQSEYALPLAISMPGPGAFAIPQGLANFFDLNGFVKRFSIERPLYPLADCVNFEKRDQYRVQLPTQLHITALPHAVDVADGSSRYSSEYALSGHMITVTRTLTVAGLSGVCSQAQYQQLHDLAMVIGRDLHSQVLYQ